MASTEPTEATQNHAKRKRAKRSLHPGVLVRKPLPHKRMPYFRAEYTDPDSGKVRTVKLDPDVLSTKESRTQWAIRKSLEIRQRAAELEAGAPRETGIAFDDAIKLYFDNHPDLRTNTLRKYKSGAKSFLKWIKKNDLAPDTLGRGKLMEFRAWALNLPKQRNKKGGKRGEATETRIKRSKASVNSDLRSVHAILTWLVAAERLPKLTPDILSVALKLYKEDKNEPEFLEPDLIRLVLEACIRHDDVTFKMTRDEKKKLGERRDSEKGSTPRYSPVAPLVLGAFLSGMRIDELCLIDFRTHLDFKAKDFHGKLMGQVKLRAEDTKTHKPRNVTFDVSPLLRELFLALAELNEGRGPVFGITHDEANEALQRLRESHEAPDNFTYQIARSTCSTYLTCAPAIYGAAAPFHAAKQLGHSQKVQEESYAGLVKGISPDLKTLEAVMEIEEIGQRIIERVRARAQAA